MLNVILESISGNKQDKERKTINRYNKEDERTTRCMIIIYKV